MANHDSIHDPCKDDLKVKGSGRRRFLGAGTAATPFVLTLVSQPALGLGVTCFSPSRSLSKNTSLSQDGQYGTCSNAESPGNYKTNQTSADPAYHWPASVPPSTKFHPLFNAGTINLRTRFYRADGITSRSLGWVLSNFTPGDGNVAFHIIGAYLNTKGGNGAQIPATVITPQGIIDIWNEYALNGYYLPMGPGGPQWNGSAIVLYLTSNGIIT